MKTEGLLSQLELQQLLDQLSEKINKLLRQSIDHYSYVNAKMTENAVFSCSLLHINVKIFGFWTDKTRYLKTSAWTMKLGWTFYKPNNSSGV